MKYTSNAKIIRASKMLEGMTINDNNIVTNNDFNSFTDDLDNKNLEKKNIKVPI